MRNFDYSNLASRSWDSEIIGLIAQIHEYKGRQDLWLKQKPTELERLIEIAVSAQLICPPEVNVFCQGQAL